MRIKSSLFIVLWMILATFLPFCSPTSIAEESPPPVDARARELFKNLADRFAALDTLAVNTTTIIESRKNDDSLPVRQVLRQRLSFRRPDGLAVKRLVGSAPVTELHYLKPNASMLIPGAGVIERRVGSLPLFLSSRSFGYERSTKSNRIMDQNFAAVTIRDLLVRARTNEWDEDVVGYEYLGHEGTGYGAIHGVKVFEKHESVGVVSAKAWMTDGPRPRIVRVEPDVEHFKKHLGIEMDFKMTAVFDAWDFSPTFTDEDFKRPASTAKVFRTLGQAMREKLKARSVDSKMRERLIGKDVSQLEFEMVDGSKVRVADYVGKQPILLDFWASWCSPCLQGFSKWEQMLSEERFSNFAFIAVNQGESAAAVKSLQKERDWKFAIAIDMKREIGRHFEVSAIPQSIVIDKNGRIASVVFGLDDSNKVSVAAELDAVIGDGQTEEQIVEQLRARQEKVKKVVENVAPTVVGLYVRNGGGSGVIVSKDGLILTAAHVTNRAGEEVQVFLPNGERVTAKSLGADHRRDSAMLKIDGDREWPFAEISDDPLKLGDWVVAMGHPGGYVRERSAPVRLGRIIKLADTDGIGKRFFATDCTITMGDSGGPAFDLEGRVIGIHSFISTRIEENMHVPMAAYRDGWDRLLKGDVWGRSQVADDGRDKAFFGVYFVPSDENGAVIEEVVDDGPADKAGIQANDKIIAFGGVKDIKNRDELRDAKAERRAGETVSVTILRGDELIEVEVTLGKAE